MIIVVLQQGTEVATLGGSCRFLRRVGVAAGQGLGAQEVEEGSMEGMVAIERRGWHIREGYN